LLNLQIRYGLCGNLRVAAAITRFTDCSINASIGDFSPMNSLKRDITSGLAMSAAALLIALAWGSPFLSPRAAHAADPQPRVLRLQAQIQQAVEAKSKPHPGTPEHFRGY
jgi:hypothetical protein